MKRIALLFCVVGLAAAPMVNAQSREGSWETELGVIFQNSSDADFEGGTQADFDSDVSWLFGISYHYTDQLQFGGTLSFGETDHDADIAADVNGDENPDGFVSVNGDLEFMTLMGNATYNFLPASSAPSSPAESAGAGWIRISRPSRRRPAAGGTRGGATSARPSRTRSRSTASATSSVSVRVTTSATFAVNGSYKMTWIDFDQANGTPDFDGFTLSVAWKF